MTTPYTSKRDKKMVEHKELAQKQKDVKLYLFKIGQ